MPKCLIFAWQSTVLSSARTMVIAQIVAQKHNPSAGCFNMNHVSPNFLRGSWLDRQEMQSQLTVYGYHVSGISIIYTRSNIKS